MRQLILDLRPDAAPTLDNFLPAANREALQCLRAVAAGRAPDAVIYLWGPAGSGKTHLLRASVAACLQRGKPAAYLAAGQSLPPVLPGLLAVDDVQDLDMTRQVGLFNAINQAREGAGVVLAAGDAPPTRLSLRADLSTRLAWGLVYALSPLGDADKLMALTERAQARGMTLPAEVARYLLTHCRRDLPHLLALVDALDA
ncbi:MAG: DnaA regulatory inactivator Hda, partial [Thiobacillaceae bacterium]